MHTHSFHSSDFHHTPVRSFVFLTLGMCLALFTVSTIFSWFQPRVLSVSYTADSGTPVRTDVPIRIKSTGTDVQVSLVLNVPRFLIPLGYDVLVDDCLQDVLVDGVSILHFSEGLCDGSRPHRLSLPLVPGIHQLTFVTRDNGWVYHFDFAIPRSDALSLARWLLLSVILLTYLWSLHSLLRWSKPATLTLGVSMVAIFVRCLYSAVTPFFTRAHEWDRHVEYLQYVHDFFRVPPASGGWEFFQPPLYYFLGAIWWHLYEFFGSPTSEILLRIQNLSFIFSILTVVLLAGIGWVLIDNRRFAPLATALMTVLLGIVYFTSQITNDALVAPLGFLTILLGLQFYRRPSVWLWYIIVVVFSCVVLTKLNAFVLLPFIVVCVLRFFIRSRSTWKHAVLGLALFTALFAWYPVLRLALEEDVTRTVTIGSVGMNPGTSVGNSVRELATFNPVRVLSVLYVDPLQEGVEKGYFPEYFFTSVFFGEYQFPVSYKFLHFVILLLGIIVCSVVVVGIFVDLKRPSSFGLLMIVLFDSLLIAAIAIRILIPFSPLQDFRYSIFLVVPLAYYFFRGADSLYPSLRRFALSSAWALVSVEVIFLVKLAFDVSL